MGKKPDLKFDFDEILIPAINQMLHKEEKHLVDLKAYVGLVPEVILDRMIDGAMETTRMYRQRLQEYKKYSSELK